MIDLFIDSTFIIRKCLPGNLQARPTRKLAIVHIISLLMRMHHDRLNGISKWSNILQQLLIFHDCRPVYRVPNGWLHGNEVEARIGGWVVWHVVQVSWVDRCIHVSYVEFWVLKELQPCLLSIRKHIIKSTRLTTNIIRIKSHYLFFIGLYNTSNNLITTWIPCRPILPKPFLREPSELIKVIQ